MTETLKVPYKPDLRYVPCDEHEIQAFLDLGYSIYAMYRSSITETNSGAKWERTLESRWDEKLYADKDGIRDIHSLFTVRNMKAIALFALVSISKIDAEVDFDLIAKGVYSTRIKKGRYTGCNIYVIHPGNGKFKRIAYIPRELSNNLHKLALESARNYRKEHGL